MKICNICKVEKDLSNFHKNSRNGFDGRCKSCKRIIAKTKREENYFRQYCITKKSECRKKGLEFNLNPEFLEKLWTGYCPVFGDELFRHSEGRGSHKSAHLDRIDPKKGYIVGNVAWISGRANRIKYDATAQELRQIADWMESATTIPSGSTLEANASGSGEQPVIHQVSG